MPSNRHASCPKEFVLVDLATFVDSLPKEDPASPVAGAEVSPGHPASGLGRMSSFGPTPQGLEDGVIRFDKGRFAGAMAMIIGPAPNHRVELGYQMRRRRLLVSLHDFPDLTEERLDIRSGWLREELTSIFADMVTQKIKAVLNVRNAGFLRGEFESAFVQELLYQRFDFVFEQVVGAAGNNMPVGGGACR